MTLYTISLEDGTAMINGLGQVILYKTYAEAQKSLDELNSIPSVSWRTARVQEACIR